MIKEVGRFALNLASEVMRQKRQNRNNRYHKCSGGSNTFAVHTEFSTSSKGTWSAWSASK